MCCTVRADSVMRAVALAIVVSSCDAPVDSASAGRHEDVPTDSARTADLAAPLKLDMAAIFPPGNGRALVLDHCMACHGVTRMVLTQRTQEQWNYVRSKMRPTVPTLSEAEVDAIFEYLQAHFNDSTPPPKLPAWFLESSAW